MCDFRILPVAKLCDLRYNSPHTEAHRFDAKGDTYPMNAMTGFTIDRSVPLPTEGGRVGAPRKYPFPDMAVGDSILVPNELAEAARTSSYAWGRRNHCTFATRSEGTGLRIWRTA